MIKKIIEFVIIKINHLVTYLRFIKSSYDLDLVIVTGADSSHFKSLCQLLYSLLKYEQGTYVIIFDLGLIDSEREFLRSNFSNAELRIFDYTKYPSYFNIKVNAGEYAWKPVILSDILNEFKCCVCWMDAGNKITKPLVMLRKITKAVGIYSPRSRGTISDWTHPKTLEYLKASNVILKKRNLSGLCVAVDYKNSKARGLINQWKECALVKECIAPKGSGRHNHRQDQAVLSVIAHMSGITKSIPASRFGFKIHQDID